MNEYINQFITLMQDKWLSLIAIFILFFLGKTVLGLLVKKAIDLADDGDDAYDSVQEKQAKTLGDLILRSGNIVIYLVILMMILQLFNFDITPLLAGAGVIGVAIGFGAQSLAKDLISGIMIILEHRYALGDIVSIGDFKGEVVKVTMRSTVLRNEEGEVFYIANGSIAKVTNYSQSEEMAKK